MTRKLASTPLDVRGLHVKSTADRRPGTWWACSEPERPADEDTLFDLRCRYCALASWAAVLQEGDTAEVVFDGAASGSDDRARPESVAECTAHALRELHGISVALPSLELAAGIEPA